MNGAELQTLTPIDWLSGTTNELVSDMDFRKAISGLRWRAEATYAGRIARAVAKFSSENSGRLPTDIAQVRQFLPEPMEDRIFDRFEMVPMETLATSMEGDWAITQKGPVDQEYDMMIMASDKGLGSGSFEETELLRALTPAIRAYYAANGSMPDDLAQISSFTTTPQQQAALQKAVQMLQSMSPQTRAQTLQLMQRLRPK
jgi:hypothetical protein